MDTYISCGARGRRSSAVILARLENLVLHAWIRAALQLADLAGAGELVDAGRCSREK
jgi:hypothetical protein